MKRRLFCLLLLLTLLRPVPALAVQEGIPVGGIHILMTGVTGEPLEGAVFRICREVTSDELTDPAVVKEVQPVGQEYRIMTAEAFWPDRTLSGERLETVETDAMGQAAIYGLEYGTYYLVEDRAPEGYERIRRPIRITIHKYSHLTKADNICDDRGALIDNTLHIINVRYKLPQTGDLGRLTLTTGAVGVIFSAISLLLLNRRKI